MSVADVLQAIIDREGDAHLPAGSFILDRPLTVRTGQTVYGAPNHATRLFTMDGVPCFGGKGGYHICGMHFGGQLPSLDATETTAK